MTTTNALPPLAPRAWLRYDVVHRVVERLQPKATLEIGCGLGGFGARLAGASDYLGVEPDPTSFETARSRIEPRGGAVLNGIHDAVPADEQFDMVCAFEVLEHIDDDKGVLSEWTKYVRPGGHLVLSVPAFQERFGPMDVRSGHFRRYSPAEITERLTEAGMTDVEVTVYGWPLGYALEAVRNRMDARRIAAEGDVSMEQLTSASGRTAQPGKRVIGAAIAVLTFPWRMLQRVRPTKGTGLVAIARMP